MHTKEKLAILDCGGQYTKVIDRRVRELGVESDIFPIHVPAKDLAEYQGIILSGGPQSVWETGSIGCDPGIIDLHVPILGICYGMQWLNAHLGGTISPSVKKEYGECSIVTNPDCLLFDGMGREQVVLMSHGDSIEKLAPGLLPCGFSGDLVVAFHDPERALYGIQFHPEVDLTREGKQMLENFLRKIVRYQDFFSLEDRLQTAIESIRAQVGDQKILVLVSGGVDSAVSAALLLRALPVENVYAIHVDHGLMRKDESDRICESLKQLGLRHLVRENAQDLFFNTVVDLGDRKVGPLTTLIDPEDKRQLIGTLFLDAVRRAATQFDIDFDTAFWAQGTLRPDLIESGNPDISNHAHRIKTHHNDVDLVRKARESGRVVETNRDWHKDEVRQIGLMLGLDEEIAYRQPFPGPGLAVRVMCHGEDAELNSQDAQELQALAAAQGLGGVTVPLRSVGVQGDARSYRNLALLWGKGADIEWNMISALARELTNKLHSINRVAYVLGGTPDAQGIHCHPMTINPDNVDLLREIDHLVTTALESPKISQTFAVLLPVGITKPYSIVIRTFVTNDFMTGRPAAIGEEVAPATLRALSEQILTRFGDQIEFVLYDVTGKPPATCEWQ